MQCVVRFHFFALYFHVGACFDFFAAVGVDFGYVPSSRFEEVQGHFLMSAFVVCHGGSPPDIAFAACHHYAFAGVSAQHAGVVEGGFKVFEPFDFGFAAV